MPRFSDIPRGGPPGRGLTPFRAGLIAAFVIVIVVFFAFTKSNPLANPYELTAVFENTNSLAKRSPVRIAGVDVGKVVDIESLDDGSGMAKVTMEIKDKGLPIHNDATLKVRSRLFLEGNYFVELKPGTPNKPELGSGGVIGPDRTAAPVQLNQVLTTLQSETREDLRTLLKELSAAYEGKGAKGLNQAIEHWEEAYRTTSQVSDATLGTEEHDLSRVLRGQAKVFGALARDQRALSDLVTGLNQTVAAFASQEDNLRASVPLLRNVLREGKPALESLNSALPAVRRFARDALPAARSSSPTLDAQIPFIRQARRLIARRELGGVAQRLRRTVPVLADLNTRTPRSLAQTRALAACQNRVLVPFAKTPIPDPDFDWHTGEPFFEESSRSLVGLSGESRIADANSPMFRVLAGGGPATVQLLGTTLDKPLFAQALAPLNGTRPVKPTQRPVFRPGEPCENQDVPDLNALGGPVRPAGHAAGVGAALEGRPARAHQVAAQAEGLHRQGATAGKPARDPIGGGRVR